MNRSKLSMVPLVVLFTVALVACEKGPAEKAGEKIDNAAENMGYKFESATDKAGDKIEKAGDKNENKTDWFLKILPSCLGLLMPTLLIIMVESVHG